MKVSSEKLNKLDCWEYEDFKLLKNKKQNYWRLFWWISLFFFVTLVILSIVLGIFIFKASNEFGVLKCFFAIYLVFAWVVFVNVIEGEFNNVYSKLFNYFFKFTNIHSEIENYETYFIPIEKQIEEEAILILSSIENEAKTRLSDNLRINNYLRPKRNPNLYLNEISNACKNYKFNQKALAVFEENICHIKFDLEKQKHFETLRRNLKSEYIKWVNEYSLVSHTSNRLSVNVTNHPVNSRKIEKSKQVRNSKEKKEKTISKAKPLYSEPSEREHRKKQSLNKITKNEILGKNEKQDIEKKNTDENNSAKFPLNFSNDLTEDSNQLELDFETPKINLKSIDGIPKKRTTPNYESIIKASPEFYKELADKKIEIGRKGELLVLGYEKKRLIEEGENTETRLKHTSVEDGDGYGYDICSFENGKKIYIEVKTTTGSFWSNLFFTHNEYNKMEKYGEQYYLYRVCNFDIETNQAELFVFKGEDLIRKYFNFESKVYVLTEKQN